MDDQQPPIGEPSNEADAPDTSGASPAPRADQPAPQADQPASDADQPMPQADEPAADADQPAPQADEPAADADQPAPQADQPAPKADQPASDADQPMPQADEPAARADRSATRTDQPSPQADQPDLRRRRLHRASHHVGRGITTAAVIVAATTAAGALAVIAGLLTLFGWGVAIAVAILIVAGAAALRPRPVNGWLLVPVLALATPAVAVAVSGVRVLPQRGAVVEAPRTAGQIPADGYRAGLGDLLVDLRDLYADDGERVVVRAGSDLGRTVIALPQDRCFNLEVRWQTGDLRLPRITERPTVAGFRPQAKLTMLGQQGPRHRERYGLVDGRIALFGRAYDEEQGRWDAPTARAGAPTLALELESEGGSFVVRDYPEDVAPLRNTEWPINQVPPPYPPAVPLRRMLQAQAQAISRAAQPVPATVPSPPSRRETTPRQAVPSGSTRPAPTVPATRPATVPSPPSRPGTTPREAVPPGSTRPVPPTVPAARARQADPIPPSTRATKPSTRAPTPAVPATKPLRDRDRARAAALARLRPMSNNRGDVVAIGPGGDVVPVSPRVTRQWRRMAQRRQAFGRAWADRVASRCNPRGTFR